MPILRVVPHALRQARLAAGFDDVCSAAYQLGCSTQLLTKLENAAGAPISEDLLGRLSQAYACDPSTISTEITHMDVRLSPQEIHVRRMLLGYSLQDMATLSGCSFSTLWRWEQLPGLSDFDHNRLRRVSAVLECGVEDITVTVPAKEHSSRLAPAS